MFKENEFSNLRMVSINDKNVFIVDEHNYVLPFWADLSIRNQKKYSLVTYDFHTDTRCAFNTYACLQNQGKRHIVWNKFRESYIKSIDSHQLQEMISVTPNLTNDEHIYAAIDFGYIAEAHVITLSCSYYDHLISYYLTKNFFDLEPQEKSDTPYKSTYKELKKYRLNRLEDEYISDTKFVIPSMPFILDFDLDYFPTRESLIPKNRKIISELINRAEIITIAREEKCFLENSEQLSFSVDEAEQLLLDLIDIEMSG